MCRLIIKTWVRVERGFTLLELLITLIILSLVIGAGVPSLLSLMASMRLQGAAQATYALLQYARSDALRTNQERFVVWDSYGVYWCAVVATTSDCKCLIEDCSISGVLRQINGSDYKDVEVQAKFATGNYTRFDGLRGLAEGYAGHVAHSLRSDSGSIVAELRVVLSLLGRVRYCKKDGEVSDYPLC